MKKYDIKLKDGSNTWVKCTNVKIHEHVVEFLIEGVCVETVFIIPHSEYKSIQESE